MGRVLGKALTEDLMRRLQTQSDLVAIVASVGDEGPDTAPVSLFCVASPSRLLFALAHDRQTLANIAAGSRLAVSVTVDPDVAVTILGRAALMDRRMIASDHVVAVEMTIESVKDDRHPAAEITERVRYRWSDPERAALDAALLSELRSL